MRPSDYQQCRSKVLRHSLRRMQICSFYRTPFAKVCVCGGGGGGGGVEKQGMNLIESEVL